MTGTYVTYYPSEDGCRLSAGAFLRLKISEAWNDDTCKSDITMTLQVYSTYTGRWTTNGTVAVNNVTAIASNVQVQSGTASAWSDTASWVATGVEHDADGKLKITLKVTAGGYSHFAIVNSLNASVYGLLNATSGTDIELTTLEVGNSIYIGADRYDCYIGNGTSFERYSVKIGDGSSFG